MPQGSVLHENNFPTQMTKGRNHPYADDAVLYFSASDGGISTRGSMNYPCAYIKLNPVQTYYNMHMQQSDIGFFSTVEAIYNQ